MTGPAGQRLRGRRIARVALLVLPVAVLAVALLAAGARRAAWAQPDAGPASPGGQRAAVALERVDVSLDGDPTFGGLQVLGDSIQVSVVGTPSSAVRSTVDRLQQHAPVEVRPVEHSLRALTALTERIGRDRDRWAAVGIEPAAWGPDVGRNRVTLLLAGYTDAAAARMLQEYGSDLLTVEPGAVSLATGG